VGETTAKELARYFGNLEQLMVADMESLQQVPDVGRSWPRVLPIFSPRGTIVKSSSSCVQPVCGGRRVAARSRQSSALGLVANFRVDWNLAGSDAGNAKERIEAAGGKVAGSVSKKLIMWWQVLIREASMTKRSNLE